MRNLRQLRSAVVLAMVIGTGMVMSSPTLHAQAPGSDRSKTVRCALLLRAIAAAGADTELGASLQALYNENCVAQ
jgi:hypothetical protein